MDPPKVKSPGRSKTGGKTPKAKPNGKEGDNATDRGVGQKQKVPVKATTKKGNDATDCRVKAKDRKCKGPQHVDDDNYDLDLETGKFKQKKKTLTLEDNDIEMEEIDDEDRDMDYDPDKDDDVGDDDEDNGDEENDDDDDFPIPALCAHKPTKKTSTTTGDKSKNKKAKQPDQALDDLADFVEQTFPKKPTRQGVRKTRVSKDDDGDMNDGCINPKEAARFRKAMRSEAQELENTVRQGVNVKEAYETLIANVIEACKNINYEIPDDLEASDILPTIEDPTCKAWQLKLQGVQTAGKGELNVSKADNLGVCIAKRKYEIKAIAKHVEDISKDWMPLKRKNLAEAMRKIMGNMSVAHRMVLEACQELIGLLDEVDLPLWCKLVDMTTRPLVVMEVPEITVMCEEAKQMCKENQQHWSQMTDIAIIMEAKNLPFLPTAWGYHAEDRAKKVVAGIIYKYVKDQMHEYKLLTPAMEVGSKYATNVTTMNRHILGKKYAGGKASTSGTKRPVAVKAMTKPVDQSTPGSGKKEPLKRKDTKAKGKGTGEKL